MQTLFDIYQSQNKKLPGSVDARFADPQFASAAQRAGITKDQYRINSGNASFNNRISALYGQAAMPTAPAPTNTLPQGNAQNVEPRPTVAPTAVTAGVNRFQGLESEQERMLRQQQQANQDYFQSQANSTIDEGQIQRDTLSKFQAEIDATNRIYADKLRRAQVQGQGRIGTSGAVNARRGQLGSDFGNAQTDTVISANEDIYGSIEQERRAAESAILTQARESGTRAIADKRAAKESGIEKYVTSLSGAVEASKKRATDLARSLLASRIAYSDYDPTTIEEVAKSAGVSVNAIKSAYDEMKGAQDAENAKAQGIAAQQEFENSMKQGGLDFSKEKFGMEFGLSKQKFAQDQKQFGMEYALKQQDMALKRQDAADKKKVETGNPVQALDSLNFLDGALEKAMSLKGAAGASGISRTAGNLLVGDTQHNRLAKNLDSIRVNLLATMADPAIKKFFGPQMSNADVQLMMGLNSTLDPVANTPQDIEDEIVRIQQLTARARVAIQAQQTIQTNPSTQVAPTTGQYKSTSGRTYNLVN